ncbi:hypothetical protein [Chryseobacterium binzhouense]|uniref:hypothetical protein n=1 Tax=Chryseobacterium binzhouense TaxID=2593646 RepID=UPI00118071A1|nr:hypothetical protein [Chryseobacterium binzhouense]
MIRKLIPFLSLLLLSNCQDGPKAAFNEEFVKANLNKELPFEKLVGKYQLDEDSKKRYKIICNDSILLTVRNDSTFVAENYLDYKTDSLRLKKLEGKLLYTNKFKESFLNFRSRDLDFNGGGGFEIYYRKKDSVLALYIYTPPIKGQEHGDYLRYIKVK